MAAFNLTTAVELMKRLYPDGLENILYEMGPVWGMVKKWKGFTNEGKFLVWKFAAGGGSSTVFATAQQNKGASSFKKPFITRAKEYALASMDGETLDATSGNPEAIAEVFKVAMDDATYNVSRSIAFQAFRNGGGARAQLAASSAGAGTDTITLDSNASMQGLEPGMWVQGASTDGTTGSVAAGRAQILSLDRDAKTVTTSANWNTLITGITDAWYLFREGDFNNVIKGFQAWLPDTAPTSGDSFFGIDRSTDPSRLAGIRYAPTSGTVEEILVNATSIALDHGARPDLAILNPLDMANLVNQIGSKRTIPETKSAAVDKPHIGYRGVMLYGAGGTVEVVSDPMCQRYKCWLLTKSTWEDWCLGDVPRILNRDGQQSLRETNADADELRVGGYMQRVCTNPGANVNITLPTAA